MPSPESLAIRSGLQREDPERTTSLEEERRAWVEACAQILDPPGISVHSIALGGVAALEVCPPAERGDSILYVHGGGLVSGAPETHRILAAELARTSGCRVVVPRYRLLPENTSNDAMVDVCAAMRELGKRHEVGRLCVGGDSSGAALALSSILSMRDEALPIAGFFAISGAFDALLRSASMHGNADVDPTISRAELVRWQGTVAARGTIGDLPFNLMDADLRGVPPTLLLAGSDELWRDDSARLYDRLLSAGTQAQLSLYQGMWHVWPMYGSFPEARQAIEEIARFCGGAVAGISPEPTTRAAR